MSQTYDFDGAFQTKIAALLIRDPVFNARIDGLIETDYFTNIAEATLVSLHLDYWGRYKICASGPIFVKLIKDAIAKKRIRSDLSTDVLDAFKRIWKADLSDRDYVVDEVASFAKHQAMLKAMEKAVEAVDKRDFDKAEGLMKAAFLVGSNEEGESVDVFADVDARTQFRKDLVAGKNVKPAITTGFRKLDEALYHNGWGRGELSLVLGGPKRGKSILLMNSAVNACISGFNVLHVSLENSVRITTDRIDAYLTKTSMQDIKSKIMHIDGAMKHLAATKKLGAYKLHQYPTGSFRPSDLRRLLERYRARGVIFDLIVVDYWDLMRPDVRTGELRHDSREVGVELRAISMEQDAAVLTASQLNREGYRAHTAGSEHVSEDFSKIMTADIAMTINADEDDKAAGKARLFFASGRNQMDGYTMEVKQALERMTFIERVLSA